MGQHTITLGFVLLALSAIALLIGLRGRRIDREPRCPSRRCKYALGSVIEARRASEGEPFPLTCPECGRVIAHEREFRIGTRRKIKTALALALITLLPALGLLGFEGYAAWKSTSAVSTMPLWLLMRQAERDSGANRFVHQRELLERVKNNTIPPTRIPDVVERILDWQADPRVEMASLPDAIPELALQGHVTLAQMQRFWDQYYHFTLVLPPTVEPGEPLPFTIHAEGRVGFRGGPIPEKSPWDGPSPHANFSLGYETHLFIERVTINGRELVPEGENTRLRGHLRNTGIFNKRDFAWATTSDVWDAVRAPNGTPGNIVEFTVDARWNWGGAFQKGTRRDPKTNQPTLKDQWLSNRGITVGGAFTLRGTTRIVERGSLAVVEDRSSLLQDFIRREAERTHLEVTRQPFGEVSVTLQLSSGHLTNRPRLTDPAVIFADQELRFGDWTLPLRPREISPNSTTIFYGWIDDRAMQEVVARAALVDHEGWSLALIPRPERALLAAERPRAWAGDPIVVPLRVEVDWRCWDPPPDPKLPD
jgi:hypothetical protein